MEIQKINECLKNIQTNRFKGLNKFFLVQDQVIKYISPPSSKLFLL